MVFGALSFLRDIIKDWTEERVIQFGLPSEIEDVPEVRRLKQDGHEIRIVRPLKVEAKRREGYEAVVLRDRLKRPQIIVVGRERMLVMHKAPSKS